MPFQFRKEAIEEDLNSNFPSQGQGNPPLYYSLSEVVVPTYSINSTAEGSGLPSNLQTAWDFSTGSSKVTNTTATLISNTGFWQVGIGATFYPGVATNQAILRINDGVSNKPIWALSAANAGAVSEADAVVTDTLIVFLRSGDSLEANSNSTGVVLDVWYRQIATVNGTLVNPLGFSFA